MPNHFAVMTEFPSASHGLPALFTPSIWTVGPGGQPSRPGDEPPSAVSNS